MRWNIWRASALVIGLACLPFVLVAQDRMQGPVSTPQRQMEPAAQSDEGAYGDPAPADQQVASTLTLTQGSLITVRLTQFLSSDRNRPGDGFAAVLDQPLVLQGWVVARRGQTASGEVAAAQNAGRVRGVSQLAVALNELMLVDGQQIPVKTQLVESSGDRSKGRDAEGIAAATGIGAAVGAAAGAGKGAAIGAAAGAAVGIVGVLTTRGRATELYPETLLTFRLLEPVTISTERSRHAFRPVTQEDFDRKVEAGPARASRRATEIYPALPPYYYPPYYYYYPRPYYYPGLYFGYYGYGPQIYLSPRVHIGRGFRRH